jgi:hypothetical protein
MGHRVMRRQVISFTFFGFVTLLATPMIAGAATSAPDDTAATVAVQRVAVPATGLRDEAAMVLVGTALIGLAAAVRRAA